MERRPYGAAHCALLHRVGGDTCGSALLFFYSRDFFAVHLNYTLLNHPTVGNARQFVAIENERNHGVIV